MSGWRILTGMSQWGDKMLRNNTGNDDPGHSRGSIADMTSPKSVQEAFVLILYNLRMGMLTYRYVDYVNVFVNYVKDVFTCPF